MAKRYRIVNQTATLPKVKNEPFWKFRNLAGDDEKAELLLYGDIAERSWWDDAATPKKFAEDLAALGAVKEITVYINSGGGDVFAAQAIGNMLERNSATVIAHIDGLCASAATIVACHADKVVAAADASYMVHPPSMGVCDYLTAEDMRNCLKALDTIRGNIVALYAKKTGKSEDECGTWMDETNWWTAAQAKENGFVDEVDDEETDTVVENRNGMLFVNSIGMGLPFDKAPDFVKSRMGAKTPGGFSNATNNPGQTGTQEEEAMEIKNKDDLMKAYPDMVNEIRKDAAIDAINRERARIKDIQDMTLPGMEQVMQDALYGEHPMDATAYAKEVAKAAKKQAQNHVTALHDDAKNSGANGVQGGGDDQTDVYMDGFDGVYTHGIWEYSNQTKGVKIRVEIGSSGRTKRIQKYASSQADAERRLQAAMNNANHSATQVKFTLALAQIELSESQTIQLTGYGKLSGKYFIDKVSLTYSRNGLEMQLKCSKVPDAETTKVSAAGASVTLNNAPLYYTSVDKKPVRKVSGHYFLYDGINVAGRYRITNLKSRCGKTPVGKNVTGWVNAADVGGVT